MSGFDAVDLPAYDGPAVVVVGNGPVGQTVALLLARWGIPTVVLDRRTERDVVGSKSICQQRDVLDVWDAVGAGSTIADQGVTWVRARTFYRDRELFCIEFADHGRSVFPPFVNISQSHTEQLLAEQVARQPLVEERWGHDVTALSSPDRHDEHVAVTVAGPEGEYVLRAPYAVLCAGSRSDDLRAQLGVSFEGRSFEDHFLICDIRAELPGWEQERRFYFDPEWNPGRQVLIHPCPGSTYRIDWQVPRSFDLAEEERTGALDRRIRQIVGEADYEVVWKSVYRFHSRCADRMRAGRVLAAGDSAHVVAPFGARGLNSGVGDADNLAWKLAFVLRGWSADSLLDSYDDERRAAARENLEVTTATMDFLVPQTEEAWQRRRATLEQALTDPDARARVDSGRLSEPFWYVDSPLTTPDPTRPPATRPPRGHAPESGVGVLVPDCPVQGGARRLRALARRGLLLLVVDPRDVAAAAAATRHLTGPPVRVHAMAELSPDGTLQETLGARAGEVWVLRPDAYVAAVVPSSDPAGLRAAVSRCVAVADEV